MPPAVGMDPPPPGSARPSLYSAVEMGQPAWIARPVSWSAAVPLSMQCSHLGPTADSCSSTAVTFDNFFGLYRPHSTTPTLTSSPTRPTRLNPCDDPREDVGVDVGVVECGLICHSPARHDSSLPVGAVVVEWIARFSFSKWCLSAILNFL